MRQPLERYGSFELLKRLGAGATSEAFLARSLRASIPSPLVIKRLHTQHLEVDEFVRRFRHEAEVAQRIQHRNVARCYDHGILEGAPYIAFEYIQGWNLKKVIEDRRQDKRPLTLPTAIELIGGILDGLDAIHNARATTGERLHLVHRDLSPRNIMIHEDGIPVIIDLGLGKSQAQDWRTRTGAIMGSPGYMSPEQVRSGIITHLSDIYSTGLIFFELLTLTPYFRRGSLPEIIAASAQPVFRPPSQSRPEIPPELDDILAKALAITPEHRYPTARAFRDALADLEVAGDDFSTRTEISATLWDEYSKTALEIKHLVEPPTARIPLVADPAEITQIKPTRLVAAPSLTPAPKTRRAWTLPVVVIAALGAGMIIENLRRGLEPEAPVTIPAVVSAPEPKVDIRPRPALVEPTDPAEVIPDQPTTPGPGPAKTPRRPPPTVVDPPVAPPPPPPAIDEKTKVAQIRAAIQTLGAAGAKFNFDLEFILANEKFPDKRVQALADLERRVKGER